MRHTQMDNDKVLFFLRTTTMSVAVCIKFKTNDFYKIRMNISSKDNIVYILMFTLPSFVSDLLKTIRITLLHFECVCLQNLCHT